MSKIYSKNTLKRFYKNKLKNYFSPLEPSAHRSARSAKISIIK